MSLIERVMANETDAPCHPRHEEVPTGVLPRVGFSPIKPVNDAGILIEPPPSLAAASGTIFEATAEAAPPEDPPE